MKNSSAIYETHVNDMNISQPTLGDDIRTTIVTAGDQAFAWGAFLLVASMRRNGMNHPVIVGAMDWTDEMKKRVLSLGNNYL